MKTYLIVMLGGSIGTGFRMFLSGAVAARFGETFPFGTLIVNVLGSFVIGLFAGLTGPEGKFLTSPLTRQFVTIGILGGFTTFSSFSLQTIALTSDGEWFRAALNVTLSILLCLSVCWLGTSIASILNR